MICLNMQTVGKTCDLYCTSLTKKKTTCIRICLLSEAASLNKRAGSSMGKIFQVKGKELLFSKLFTFTRKITNVKECTTFLDDYLIFMKGYGGSLD